jgi:hypothetical protein
VLLNLFKSLLQSPDYLERLKSHYRLFRAAVEKESAGGDGHPRPAGGAENGVGAMENVRLRA